jgi:hypothetical protein
MQFAQRGPKQLPSKSAANFERPNTELNGIYESLNDVLMHGGFGEEVRNDIMDIRDTVYRLLY